ncbi:hypothetical protein [Candidatus Lokiarchaeum ossiferum]
MTQIKCDTCIYLGGRHEKGVIPIQSGAIPIFEPYATCLKRQYFVLEREVEKCQDYKHESEKLPQEKSEMPYSFTTASILNLFEPGVWISIEDIISKLSITEKEQKRYLPLKIKSIIRAGQLQMKLGANKLIYSLKD